MKVHSRTVWSRPGTMPVHHRHGVNACSVKVLQNQLFTLPHVPLKDRLLFIGASPRQKVTQPSVFIQCPSLGLSSAEAAGCRKSSTAVHNWIGKGPLAGLTALSSQPIARLGPGKTPLAPVAVLDE